MSNIGEGEPCVNFPLLSWVWPPLSSPATARGILTLLLSCVSSPLQSLCLDNVPMAETPSACLSSSGRPCLATPYPRHSFLQPWVVSNRLSKVSRPAGWRKKIVVWEPRSGPSVSESLGAVGEGMGWSSRSLTCEAVHQSQLKAGMDKWFRLSSSDICESLK